MTASFTTEELCWAIEGGRLAESAQDKKITRQDFFELDRNGRVPLHMAAVHGCLDQAAVILENNGEHFTKDDFLKPNSNGSTSLHAAAVHGCLDQAAVILENNGEHFTKDDFLKPNSNGSTSLHAAAGGGHLDQIFIAEFFVGWVGEMEELWQAVPEVERSQVPNYPAIRQRAMELSVQRVRPVLELEHGTAAPNPSSKSARRSKRRPTH
jgi:hypothetical protein